MLSSQENTVGSYSNWSPVSAHTRFDNFVSLSLAAGQFWLIGDESGFVQLALDEGACLPVWSSEEQAQDWCQDEWQSCQPQMINVKQWLDVWLPSMAQQGAMVSVDPQADADAYVLEADDLRLSLLQKMANQQQLEIAIDLAPDKDQSFTSDYS